MKAVVFDIGGVVISNTIRKVYRDLAENLGVDYPALMNIYKENRQALLDGSLKSEDFATMVEDRFGVEGVLEEWKACYVEVMKVNDEIMNFIDRIKPDFKVAAVTNMPDVQYKIIKGEGVLAPFDPAVVSCQSGAIKPGERIYEIALERMGLEPGDCVVVDDRERNLEVAREMGFRTVLYTKNYPLFKELGSMGIKAED